MESWIMFGLGILANIITSALAFFVKRSLSKSDERQKATENEMLKRQDKMEENLCGQIEKLQMATEARMEKGEDALEKLTDRFNEHVAACPMKYVDKETWMMSNQNTTIKLDRILAEVARNGGREGNG